MTTETWPDRPGTYDADKAYDESAKAWTVNPDDLNKSGGKQKEVLVVISNFKIYFGSLS